MDEPIETTAARLRTRLVAALHAEGVLPDPRWRTAFTDVPRHVFVPRYFHARENEGWHAVGVGDADWLEPVYEDRVLVTQLDDEDRWQAIRESGPVPGSPTSSSSMPTIMAVMLEVLDVADGHRVLEIGTGTGYNAALLCHRLGDGLVSTVDVDGVVVSAAADRLAEIGYRPRCVAVDGTLGYEPAAPYDRVLCTCAVSTIPLPWLDQTRPGGIVVTTLNRPIGAGLLKITAGHGSCGRGVVLPEDGRFMPLRAHRARDVGTLVTAVTARPGRSRPTDLTMRAVTYPGSPFEFFAGLALADAVPAGPHLLVHPDGSWARHHGNAVSQGGPRLLWDLAEAAYDQWRELGEPRRERFGVTVSPQDQHLWLDRPDGPHRWPLGAAR